MKFINVIFQSGYGNVVRFLLLFITISILILNTLLSLIPNSEFKEFLNYQLTSQFIGIVSLAILGDLLYRSIQNSTDSNLIDHFNQTGITDISSSLEQERLAKVLKSSKHIIILNTWIFNLTQIRPILQDALKDKNTMIEFTVLKLSGKYAQERGIELNRNVKKAIIANLDELHHFVSSLEENKRKRIKVYEFDSYPKFSIYGTTEKASIAFFFPKVNIVDSPQVEIDRGKGYFSKLIWEYYETLEKNEITDKVLSNSFN